ncbi:ER membrane protein complex subunit 6 [Balamuthia mandrillaris]
MAATNVGHPAADGEEEKKSYNLDAIRKNHRLVYFSRILVACVAGCGTGIIGYTGLTGFLCYFGAAAFLSLVLWVKLGFNTEPYFTSWLTIWTEALFEGLMTFILFWTLFYGVLHCY